MSTRKILLVDDSKSARYALRLLLQKHDCEVDTAESGESALEKVKDSLPDAIFMDHLMPGMNGFEALEALKANSRTQHIPVVMCTSNDDAPYQKQALEKGALGILPKPATPQKLQAVLQAIDQASSTPAMAAEEPAMPAAAAAPPPPSTLAETAQESTDTLKIELQTLLEQDIRPYIEQLLESRLQSMQQEISEAVLGRSAQQLAEWSEAEMANIRSELGKADKGEALAARMEGQIQQLKGELVKMETSHAQVVVQKISNEILPDMVHTQSEDLSRQIQQRLSLQLDDLAERLVEQIPQSPQLIRGVTDAAETAAEHKAADIAKRHAREIALQAADEKASEMNEFLMDTAQSAAQSANGKIYAAAAAAALVGILSAGAVYFLLA